MGTTVDGDSGGLTLAFAAQNPVTITQRATIKSQFPNANVDSNDGILATISDPFVPGIIEWQIRTDGYILAARYGVNILGPLKHDKGTLARFWLIAPASSCKTCKSHYH